MSGTDGQGARKPTELAAHINDAVMAGWGARSRSELAKLGRRLRELGLTRRALEHCFGVGSPVQTPERARLYRPAPGAGVAPAALMAHLWTGGAALPADRVRARLGADFAVLEELGLLLCTGDQVQATVTMVPAGEALVVSDRADVTLGRHIALVADDSALHTAGMVPERAHRPGLSWLDVGTGSGFVPLVRPGAAARILGTDINPRAIAFAGLGAVLSGVGHLELAVADLLAGGVEGAPWDLITFNAPIPAGVMPGESHKTPWYRRGAADILQKFWDGVGDLVSLGGEVIVHSWLPDEFPGSFGLGGRMVVLRYTPPGHEPAFGVTWWQKDGPEEQRRVNVELTPAMPHVTRSLLGAAGDVSL